VRTVRVKQARAGPATFAMVPGPGEPPVAVWRLDHSSLPARGIDQHAHDFPSIVYFEAPAALRIGHREWTVATGDVYVIAPGEVIGRLNPHGVHEARGWTVSFTPDALGPDVPGSSPAWRAHPLLFPFVQGAAVGALRLAVPATARAEWESHLRALERELRERRDGYREAALAQLVLLLVQVSRLAADVVGDLRMNEEPLLAEVFAVIERRYPEPLSLRDVARAVNLSPGHLATTVRRRTGRTVLEWITERRMVQARRLLVGTARPVGEIAREVGYPDAGYFTRLFTRTHGTTPTRWRTALPD
jgi:AraC family transcriptional regulator, transcriptional activator of pobA